MNGEPSRRQPAWDIGLTGPSLAAVLYRLRAEGASGVLEVRGLTQTAFIVVTEGRPVRLTRSFEAALDVTGRGTIAAMELARTWRALFEWGEGTARFYATALPLLPPSLPNDWMGLIRGGLDLAALNEETLRRVLEPLLRPRTRVTLVEPVPTVLVELDELESAIAGRLREGVTLIAVLQAAQRFGNTQALAVLRAAYTLLQLGLLQAAPAVTDASAATSEPATPEVAPPKMVELGIVLARAGAARQAVLGNIFERPETAASALGTQTAPGAAPASPEGPQASGGSLAASARVAHKSQLPAAGPSGSRSKERYRSSSRSLLGLAALAAVAAAAIALRTCG